MQKSHPKGVNPRDIAGEQKKKTKFEITESLTLLVSKCSSTDWSVFMQSYSQSPEL